MTTERIKEIQSKTAYPESVSVQQALLQVWNECEQEQLRLHNVSQRSSYSSELEALQKELKKAEHRYVYGKDTVEQNNANLDMMIILNKIRKLKGIEE